MTDYSFLCSAQGRPDEMIHPVNPWPRVKGESEQDYMRYVAAFYEAKREQEAARIAYLNSLGFFGRFLHWLGL
jgi:hypothetical protein